MPRSQVKAIQKILKEKSSTVQGWREIIGQRQKTLSTKYGINFKSEAEMKLFFKSEVWKGIQRFYDSKQSMRIISHKLDDSTVSEIIEELEKFRGRTDPDMADKIAKQLGFSGEAEALKYRS